MQGELSEEIRKAAMQEFHRVAIQSWVHAFASLHIVWLQAMNENIQKKEFVNHEVKLRDVAGLQMYRYYDDNWLLIVENPGTLT